MSALWACLDCLRLVHVFDSIVFGTDKIVFGGFKTLGTGASQTGKVDTNTVA